MNGKTYIEIFDTTLRDGTQGEAINLSIHDKLLITEKLDDFGINIIEGGWPGSNPRDEEYFREVHKLKLTNAQICAFGSTARFPDQFQSDANLQALLKSETPYVSIFGKTWRFHSKNSLGLNDEENEMLIFNSVSFLKEHGRKVIFDAEHFFDGFRENQQFALRMIRAAAHAGADVVVLCDTNGGSLPHFVSAAVTEVVNHLQIPVGIHAHNDGELGVANSLAAIFSGAVHVQGTINGVGERCGNANLLSVIANLSLKTEYKLHPHIKLKQLASLSHYADEIMNLVPNHRAPFVGKSAFTHKGGIHVSSILKDSRMYEHIPPETIGNKQNVVISDLSGQSNIRYKAEKLGIPLPVRKTFSKEFVRMIKSLEYEGFQYDGAEASFELLLLSELDLYQPYFRVLYSKTNVLLNENQNKYAEVVLKVQVEGEIEHTAADGNGPVNALDKALRKALIRFYPQVKQMHLTDYKVRVLGGKDGTAALVRVLVESSDGENSWSTVGVSHDIIEASLQALSDSINYKIHKMGKQKMNKRTLEVSNYEL